MYSANIIECVQASLCDVFDVCDFDYIRAQSGCQRWPLSDDR